MLARMSKVKLWEYFWEAPIRDSSKGRIGHEGYLQGVSLRKRHVRIHLEQTTKKETVEQVTHLCKEKDYHDSVSVLYFRSLSHECLAWRMIYYVMTSSTPIRTVVSAFRLAYDTMHFGKQNMN